MGSLVQGHGASQQLTALCCAPSAQMLAHHHLQNFTLPTEYLQSHLAYEWERNQDTYGMRVRHFSLFAVLRRDLVWHARLLWSVQEHVYNTTVPATCLPHTGFAGVWTPATHAEFSNGTGPYMHNR